MNCPPFPPLEPNTAEWRATDVLGTWAGYRGREDQEPSTGKVDVVVPRRDAEELKPKPPSDEQIAAYAYLKANEAAVTDAVLDAVVKAYAPLLREWRLQDPHLPMVRRPADLKDHICPNTIFIHNTARDGVSYVGIAFWCTWDPEHDLGVLLHRRQVMEVGTAETSFNPYFQPGDSVIE